MHPSLTLEKRIEAELKSYDGTLGLYIDDLHGNVITMNATEKFETASSIKTYILATLFDQVEQGKKSLSDLIEYKAEHFVDGSGVIRDMTIGTKLDAKSVATLMIIVSDNVGTNMMIDYLGIDVINETIRKLGCKNTVLHNPLHFDKYDDLGTTTPEDYASIFIRIAKGELISPEASEAMKQIFKRQHYNSMITREFPVYLMDAEDNCDEELFYVASKSGSMDACRNDGGIVHTPYGEYVIVMLNKNFSDKVYYNDHPAYIFGSRVSKLIFDQYLALEGRIQ